MNRGQVGKGEDNIFKIITFAVLFVSVIGCNPLKEKFRTGEETPELEAARAECRSLADKDTSAKGEGVIRQMDRTRVVYDTCMEKKGYDQYGKKVK